MSNYCNKCDVYDFIGNYSDEQLRNSKIFIGDNIVPLKIENQHDLSPYYAHIVMESYTKDNVTNIRISNRSYVDVDEEERLEWILKDFKRYRNKCKRKKIPYVEEEALTMCCWFSPTDIEREIAKRVGIYGDKATTDGLHRYMSEYYRKNLLDTMLNLGWDKHTAKYWIWKDYKYLFEDDD